MLSTLHNKTLTKRRGAEQGFTLIELLVVIVIIGILAAIAIPAFLNQRAAARDASVTSDVRNAATEAQTALAQYPDATYFALETGTSTTTAPAQGPEPITTHVGAPTGKVTFFIGNSRTDYTTVVINLSNGGRIGIRSTGVAGEYRISGYNPGGKHFNGYNSPLIWNSAEGGLQN